MEIEADMIVITDDGVHFEPRENRNFILEIDREDAYRRFAESIGKAADELTVAEKNIAVVCRVILSGMAMLDTAIFYKDVE